jgi:hypothetical protein
VVIRLLISEGPRHPELLDYYYENVVSRGLAAISQLIDRGVERGEFRKTNVSEFPQLILAPVMLGVIWKLLFEKRSLDTDTLIDTQIDMTLAFIKA